jgi:hypothetical protein
MANQKNKHKEAVDLFNDGWDHFLKCINFRQSSLDAEALEWMNDVSVKMRALKGE